MNIPARLQRLNNKPPQLSLRGIKFMWNSFKVISTSQLSSFFILWQWTWINLNTINFYNLNNSLLNFCVSFICMHACNSKLLANNRTRNFSSKGELPPRPVVSHLHEENLPLRWLPRIKKYARLHYASENQLMTLLIISEKPRLIYIYRFDVSN